MKNKNNQLTNRKTIKRHYIATLLVSLLIMLVFSVMLVSKDRDVYKADVINVKSGVLANSTAAYYSYLITLMLRNNEKGINNYLRQVRVEEKLEDVKFLKPGSEAMGYLEQCYLYSPKERVAGYIPSCHFIEKDHVYVIQEFTSGTRIIGYLIKSQRVALMPFTRYFVQRPMLLLWFAFVMFFSMYYMYELHVHLVKPLTYLSTKADNLEFKTDERYKLHEVNCLAHALAKAQGALVNNSRLAAIGQMSSHIAHDMRSPLSVLKAYVGMQPESADESEREYGSAAKRSVNKLLRMADDLVDYAKAKKIQKEPVLLKQMYGSGIRSEIIGGIEDKRARLDVDISIGLRAEMDGYRMARAISNIMLNAIRAVGEGVGYIKISAQKFDTHDLVMRVKDNGCGIQEKDLPHIFENFFSTDRKKGTGLGLSYCKQVVEAHGGTIEVESEVGKGTTFTIRIPNCVLSETDARAYRNQPQLKIDGRRFILIDDDADIRMRWRKIVEQSGGQVVGEADSPEKATGDGLDCAAADVAIVDYSFNGSEKTGVDVVAYLRKKGLKEIHMCTGYADDDAVRKAAFEAGADSVIQKDLG